MVDLGPDYLPLISGEAEAPVYLCFLQLENAIQSHPRVTEQLIHVIGFGENEDA